MPSQNSLNSTLPHITSHHGDGCEHDISLCDWINDEFDHSESIHFSGNLWPNLHQICIFLI